MIWGLGEGRSTWGKAGKFLVGVASYPELPPLRDAAGAGGSAGTRARHSWGVPLGPGFGNGVLAVPRASRGCAKVGVLALSIAAMVLLGSVKGKRVLLPAATPPWVGRRGETQPFYQIPSVLGEPDSKGEASLRRGFPGGSRCHRAGDREERSLGRSVPKPRAGEETGRESEKEGGREGGHLWKGFNLIRL